MAGRGQSPPLRHSLEPLPHLRRIGPRVHLRLIFLNHPVRPNHHTNTLRVGGPGVVTRTIGHAHSAVDVTEEGKIKGELLGERLILFHGVKTDPENDGVLLFKLLLRVAEPATFGCSPRGVCLWVKPQDYGPATKIAEAHTSALMIVDAEIRRRTSWL